MIRKTTGREAATFSSYGASDVTGTWSRHLARASLGSWTTEEGEDNAGAMLIDLVHESLPQERSDNAALPQRSCHDSQLGALLARERRYLTARAARSCPVLL